jgi:hypothetical protein
MYFHRGRLSLAVRPWDVELALAIASSKDDEQTKRDPNEPPSADGDAAAGRNNRNKKERRQLDWFDRNAPEAFVAWEAVDHPDFPGQRVEVGGYRPFALRNPPTSMLADVAERHGDFLSHILRRLPRIEVARIECRSLADATYEVQIYVRNAGFAPTLLAHGQSSREVHPTRVTLDVPSERFLAGSRITYVPTIAGSGDTVAARCIVHVPDREEIYFSIVSMLAGRTDGTIELPGTN